jgi:hypothetical protein
VLQRTGNKYAINIHNEDGFASFPYKSPNKDWIVNETNIPVNANISG